jgi:hypothetical protein
MNSIKQALLTKNIVLLSKVLFNFIPTPTQEKIIKSIVFPTKNRIILNCMTRFGKTQCVSIAIGILILVRCKINILIIAPQESQAQILRGYLAEHILSCPTLVELLNWEDVKMSHIKKEVNKSKLTFKNGVEVKILSAEGSATRLMGLGGDIVIMDESCLIKDEVWQQRISRMLGDNVNSILIETGNPWDRANHFFEHWNNPEFERIHVNWKDALREGRITQEFLDSQKSELSPVQFKILYDAEFPTEATNGVFNYDDVKACINLFEKKDMVVTDTVMGVDVADMGEDKTVMWTAWYDGEKYKVFNCYKEAKSNTPGIVGKILSLKEQFSINKIFVDCIGVGVGIAPLVRNQVSKNITVLGCSFAEKAYNSKIYKNKKAEMFFRLAKLFQERKISIPKDKELISQLMKFKWEFTETGQVKISDDSDFHQDEACALVFTVWNSFSNNFVIG